MHNHPGVRSFLISPEVAKISTRFVHDLTCLPIASLSPAWESFSVGPWYLCLSRERQRAPSVLGSLRPPADSSIRRSHGGGLPSSCSTGPKSGANAPTVAIWHALGTGARTGRRITLGTVQTGGCANSDNAIPTLLREPTGLAQYWGQSLIRARRIWRPRQAPYLPHLTSTHACPKHRFGSTLWPWNCN